jgi:peptidoglycan/LPS O-acetylase OafA/YrhL
MNPGRLPQLDGVRAAAVVCVLAFHFIPGIDRYIPLGSIGVRLFFVLSGFLITRLLLASRPSAFRPALKSFYIRRSLRIFPVFYLVLATAWAMNIGPVRTTIGWHASYLTNAYLFERGSWHGSISHLWSLAVEEQFYLVWPWLILLVPLGWLPRMIVLMIGIAPLSRVLVGGPMNSVLPTSCLDSLGAGALLAVTGRPLLHVAAGPLLFAGGLLLHSDVLLDFGVSLSGAWIVASAANGFQGVAASILLARPVVYVGTISYGLYLVHGFMPFVLGRYVPGFVDLPLMVRVLLLTTGTFAIASLSWHLFEAPILSLKDRWTRRPPAASRPTAAAA